MEQIIISLDNTIKLWYNIISGNAQPLIINKGTTPQRRKKEIGKRTKVLEIVVREVEWEGGKFLAYTTFTKNNERLDVRFVKHATAKAPKEIVLLKLIQHKWTSAVEYRYPRLYIQDIIKVVERPKTKNDDLPF